MQDPKIPFSAFDLGKLQAAYDFLEQPGVLFLDCDATLIGRDMIYGIMDQLSGIGDDFIAKSERHMSGEDDQSYEEFLRWQTEMIVKAGATQKIVQEAVKRLPFSEGVEDLFQVLIQLRGTLEGGVFILSGGFTEVIHGKIDELSIPKSEKTILKQQVHANAFTYDAQGRMTGVDWVTKANRMWTPTAKIDRIRWLREQGLVVPEFRYMGVGDGSNDVSMVPAEWGITAAYIEHEHRPNIVKEAGGVYLKSFKEVLAMILSSEEVEKLLGAQKGELLEAREGLRSRFSVQ